MFYEQSRDAEPLYKYDNCSSFEHFHKSIEFIYNTGPSRPVFINLKQFELPSNSVLIIMPYQIHYLPYDPINQGYCAILPASYSNYFVDILKKSSPVSNIISNPQQAKLFYHEMRALCDNKDTDNFFKLEGHINMLLGLMLEFMDFSGESELRVDMGFMHKVIEYVNEHYREEMNIEKTAKYFGYSKYYFSRLFNSCFHTNFANYFNTVRIYNAIPLIQKYNSSEIYFKVGFSSVQQYITYFKRTTGKTPSQYKKHTMFTDRNGLVFNNKK